MSVVVSIVNYNSEKYLANLLRDLDNQDVGDLEIWLVDNASPDRGGIKLKKKFKNIRLIESKENVGFAKGHNLVLRQITADYALILNPDTRIPKNAVSEMINFMARYPGCGIASCRIVGFDGRLQPNGGDLPLGMALLVWLFNLESVPGMESLFGSFHRTEPGYYRQPRPVGWVGGTFMMVRNNVFKKIGFLPEEYFMYFEDVDFCYRAGKVGVGAMINGDLEIRHLGGGSSDDPRLAQFKGELIGLERFYEKEFGWPGKLFIKLLIYKTLFLRIAAFWLVGRKRLSATYRRVLSYV